MSRIHAAALAIAGLLFCSVASAQVQRTFVASYGNDANTATNCGLANPCRGLTAAQTVTQSGGEIVALDAAGYGAVTITKSVSILANPGVHAGISAASGNGITIATADVHVRLSGLKINGVGAENGIVMTNGASLSVENCTVSGFSTNGIWVVGAADVRIVDTLVANNGFDGIVLHGARGEVINTRALGNARVGVYADANGAVTSAVAVTNSVSSQNQYGFVSRAGGAGAVAKMTISGSSADNNSTYGFYSLNSGGTSSTLVVSSSKATQNGVGFRQLGGIFNSAGNNLVNENGTNTTGTITNIGTM